MENCNKEEAFPTSFPPQHQCRQPGIEWEMRPRPVFEDPCYTGSCKLKGKTALITGGDSGIGRAAAIAFAKEGANLAIVYLNENEDAKETNWGRNVSCSAGTSAGRAYADRWWKARYPRWAAWISL